MTETGSTQRQEVNFCFFLFGKLRDRRRNKHRNTTNNNRTLTVTQTTPVKYHRGQVSVAIRRRPVPVHTQKSNPPTTTTCVCEVTGRDESEKTHANTERHDEAHKEPRPSAVSLLSWKIAQKEPVEAQHSRTLPFHQHGGHLEGRGRGWLVCWGDGGGGKHTKSLELAVLPASRDGWPAL